MGTYWIDVDKGRARKEKREREEGEGERDAKRDEWGRKKLNKRAGGGDGGTGESIAGGRGAHTY